MAIFRDLTMLSVHEAVAYNRLEDIENIVRNGADINKKNGSGRTPLDLCALTKGAMHPYSGESIYNSARLLPQASELDVSYS